MEVNINKLIGLKIPLEGYFIMYCLYNEEKELLLSYTKNVKKIPTEVFLDLIKEGYLTNESEKPDEFSIDSIELTDKFKTDILKIPNVKGMNFDQAFDQLREHYPTKVTGPTGEVRRLQSDIERCKRLYKSVIFSGIGINEDTHKFVLQCIDFEVSERKRSRSLQYMKMLPTYLSQKGWESVEDDVRKAIFKNGTVENMDDNGSIDAI